jgi:hypothetical protein
MTVCDCNVTLPFIGLAVAQCGKMSKIEKIFSDPHVILLRRCRSQVKDQMTRAIYLILREEHHHQL